MRYKIRNTLIPVPHGPVEQSFKEIILGTLDMYKRGEDLSNSPLIISQLNKWHKDCCHPDDAGKWVPYEGEELTRRLLLRQDAFISMYEDFKANGYDETQAPVLVWFDEGGFIHTYDGYHRLLIMKHLGLEAKVVCETEWSGIDGFAGKDFPLVETLLKEHPYGQWLYQPVADERLGGWKLARNDCPQRLEHIADRIVGKRVLDVGCSEGYFSRELARLGYDVTAIDHRHGLIAAARYLSTLEGLSINYHQVDDWREFVGQNGSFDTVLFLSVIHNDMKQIGVEAGLKKMEVFRDKATRVLFETPQEKGEKEWNVPGFPQFNFRDPESIKKVESALGLESTEMWSLYPGSRPIFTYGICGEDTVPWWDLKKWLPDYRDQYWPLFNTLRQKPCRKIMEIGVHNGNNAVAMIKAAAQKVPEEEICYYGFDLFEEKTKTVVEQEFSPVQVVDFKSVKEHIKKHTTAKVTLLRGDTRKTLKGEFPTMDLIYIDGGHSIETTRSDWENVQRLMRKDTVVYFDDYNDEMPFIGSYFIVGELPTKYLSEVLPNTNYYKRPFGRLKCQLLRVTIRKPAATLKTEHFRFHIMSLPHSKTVKNWGPCAFTMLTYRFCQMMMDCGHEVYHYGTEGSDPSCTEHIEVLTEEVQKQAYGDWSQWKQLWIHNGKDLAYTTFRKNAVEQLDRRKEPGDILLISNGNWLREISDKAGQGIATVEPFVGYLGFFAKYRVFPSYAWMHHMYGKASNRPNTENFVIGNWYDAVIPHFFDPDDYTFEEKKEDYFLYLGRLIERKGIHVAVDLCKRIGAKLYVAGQPLYPDKLEQSLKRVGVDGPNVEYLGVLDEPSMDKWRSKARALIAPSIYIEPFGLIVPEALLSGTPVITTDWGAFPETVKHGEVGYRCRTMDDFIWAANNVDKISPAACREYAIANFSMERIGKAYHEYFVKVHDLFGKGWYAEHPDRGNLDWLRRY